MHTEARRFRSLDGLRGIAALVVVVYHSMMTAPRFAQIRLRPGEQALSPLEFAISCTPIRLFWAGTEAVVVFFVLSGFVLALPFARRGDLPSRYFYPRRLLRLYLPAIASLIFAFLTTLIVPRRVIPGASLWLNEHAALPVGLPQVALGSSLMHGWGGLNLSLWSLRWEVMFSVLLAAFLILARSWPKLLWVKVVTVVTLCSIWPLAGLFYANGIFIAVFGLGVLMAFNLDRLDEVAGRMSSGAWCLVLVAAVTLLSYSGLVIGAQVKPLLPVLSLWTGFAAAGAAFLVFAAAHFQPLVRLLESRVVQWLGLVSFSLYLVQDPVIVSLAEATGGFAPLTLVMPLCIGVSLMMAWIFYLGVERPAHRLSRSFLRRHEARAQESPASRSGPRSPLH